MDAGFLYMETPTLHMHTLKVAILPPVDGRRPVTFDGFVRALERKIRFLPSFQQRIQELPFPLTHPVWVVDPDFDLSRHLSHRTAEAPGGTRELNAIIGEVASRPLHRDRPLWEITMVEGLEGGRVAFVCKLHHAMADGAAALAMLYEVLVPRDAAETASTDPESNVRPLSALAAGTGEVTPSAPSEWVLRRWAIRQVVRHAASLPRLLLRTLRGVLKTVKRAIQGKRRPLPGHFSGPRTSWSGALTARRSFATTQLSLGDMKHAAKALGVKLNDVMLAVCGGALRAHLDQVEGGVPPQPLLASVPVNTQPGAKRTRGNRVGHLPVSLCTHIADPIERVRSIHAMTDEAKGRQNAMGRDLLESWIEYAPPDPYAAFSRYWSAHRLADRVRPPANVIVSNVPGPREPLSVGSLQLEALYSVGPILEGIGLNLTGWSYGDRVNVVALACPDQIEDIQALADRLPGALDELVAACDALERAERAGGAEPALAQEASDAEEARRA
jgi:diacylglycerol O-acyltransferase